MAYDLWTHNSSKGYCSRHEKHYLSHVPLSQSLSYFADVQDYADFLVVYASVKHRQRSHPTGLVRPEAIRQIEKAGLATEGLRSKSWDEFTTPVAPHLSFVFTVCDNAAKEVYPHWPGQPMTAHWGIPDPAAVQGTPDEINRAYGQAFAALDRRISLFLCLPLATLDSFALQKELDSIGRK